MEERIVSLDIKLLNENMHENWASLKNISKSVTVWHTKKLLAKWKMQKSCKTSRKLCFKRREI